MISFVQSNFVTLLGAVVGGTVAWAVLSSLVPPRRQKVQVAANRQEQARPAAEAAGARG